MMAGAGGSLIEVETASQATYHDQMLAAGKPCKRQGSESHCIISVCMNTCKMAPDHNNIVL